MKNDKNIPLSAQIYFKLRPLIIPFDIIEKHVPKKGTIVDLGCGFGIFANFLAIQSDDRKVIGIHSVDLVWGLGTIHCLTKEQPK